MSCEALKTITGGENFGRKNGNSPGVADPGKVPECVSGKNGILFSFGLADSRTGCEKFRETGERSSENKIALQKIRL